MKDFIVKINLEGVKGQFGLGLSIVKRIIDLHKGVIDVVSVEDGGSQFTVKLPQERSFHLSEKLILTKKDKDNQ